jgi:hypothetical protein
VWVFRRGSLSARVSPEILFPAAGASAREGEENETHDRTQGSVGVSSLSDAERDACDVVQALASLAALAARPAADRGDPALDDVRRALLVLAEEGGVAAARVVAHLRMMRGAGDGEAAAVPPRLGMWRDWVPPRGNIFGWTGYERRIGEVHPRRADPGE